MPWPLLAAIPGIIGAVGGGAGAAGAAGAAAGGIGGAMGGAGAAGGIGGMLGGGGGGGLMKMAGGLMGGGGQGGGQKGGGGGMMGNIMNMAKMPMQHTNQLTDQAVGMLKAQNGMAISPEFLSYMQKATGQGEVTPPPNFMQTPEVPSPEALAPAPGAGMPAVENPPSSPTMEAMAPMPGAPAPPINPAIQQEPEMTSAVATPTNPTGAKTPDAPSGGIMNPASSIMGTMAANKGQYQTDERGVTQVTESSDIAGDALGKAKKGDVVGATLAVVSGKMNQMSQMRRQAREEEQLGSEMERQMKRSSAYNDPNSVYYAAKNGAAINPSLMNQNNNLSNMMGFQKGGGTMKREFLGEEQGMVDSRPKYVQKGKSHHYSPNAFLGDIGTDNVTKEYKRTIGDVAYDVLHPNKPARVSMTFQEGGNPGDKKFMMEAGKTMGSVVPLMRDSIIDSWTPRNEKISTKPIRINMKRKI